MQEFFKQIKPGNSMPRRFVNSLGNTAPRSFACVQLAYAANLQPMRVSVCRSMLRYSAAFRGRLRIHFALCAWNRLGTSRIAQ